MLFASLHAPYESSTQKTVPHKEGFGEAVLQEGGAVFCNPCNSMAQHQQSLEHAWRKLASAF